MIKTLIIILTTATLLGCSNNPKTNYPQLDYKDWSAQQKLINAVHGPQSYNIDSVIAITDVYEIDGKKYVGLDVIYSEYLHWENLGDLYFDGFEGSEIPSFDTLKFYENFVTDYGKIYGADNVVRIEDVDFFSDCGICQRMYRIKNIRLKMYGVYDNNRKDWNTRPDSKGIKAIPTTPSKKPRNQEYLNERIPKEVQSHFAKDATYYPVTAFEGAVQLDPKNDLHNALEIYMNAINEGNGLVELKMTHPKIINAILKTEGNNYASFLDSAGFLSQHMKLNQVAYIAPIISREDSQYTKLVFIGSFELDFSKVKIAPDVSYLYSMLPLTYQKQYGVSHVIADNETKIITIKSVAIPIYAAYHTQIGEWKFSTMPYSMRGLSLDNYLWQINKDKFDANPEWWVGQMEREKDQIDVIIPQDIILKLE